MSNVIERIREDRYASLTLTIATNLVVHALTGIEDLKDLTARMADGRSGEFSEEEKMFWDLVNIKADNVIQSLQSIQKNLEEGDDD